MRSCASCSKSVYPIEELRCLDKVWHKSCYRCQTCNKVLAVHNSKGYEGLPYCSVHYPKLKTHTAVIDTPEMQQVAANTRNMSKIQYHQEYENSKGTKISVSDDPVIRGQKNISKNISNVNYVQRIPPGTKWTPYQQVPSYESQKDYNRPTTAIATTKITSPIVTTTNSTNENINRYRPANEKSPINGSNQENGNRAQRGVGSWYSESVAYPQPGNLGSNGNSVGSLHMPSDSLDQINGRLTSEFNAISFSDTKPADNSKSKKIQSAAEAELEGYSDTPQLLLIGGMRVTGSGKHFLAVYNYEAAEDDEVTFKEGDVILHGEPIDDGWMFGTVKRTGKFGMLPSNFVVPALDSNGRQ